MFIRALIVCLFVLPFGYGLKCHVCRNLVNAKCLNVTTKDDRSFLKDCPTHVTECGLEVTNVPYTKVYRDCASPDWACKHGCYKCNTDGCNFGNHVDAPSKGPTLDISLSDYVSANIYGVGAILFIFALLLVWCVSKTCSKDEIEFEDDIEDDVEYDDYENEEYDKKW